MPDFPASEGDPTREFSRLWQLSTADSNLTLHGFRRFKTTHLLNLRYLEDQIARLDHELYQTGLSLELELSPEDRLGLGNCTRDENVAPLHEIVTKDRFSVLRDLLQQYDTALINFSTLMSMETFSLLDDQKQSAMQHGTSMHELYNTRLLRVDQPSRSRHDPLQRQIHKALRSFRYWNLTRSSVRDAERSDPSQNGHRLPSQNNSLIADIISRVMIALTIGVFLVIPLATLSRESDKSTKLGVISACIVAFAILVSISLRATNLEMMVVTAGYSAVVAVLLSAN